MKGEGKEKKGEERKLVKRILKSLAIAFGSESENVFLAHIH